MPPSSPLPQRMCTAPYRPPELWDVPSSCTIGGARGCLLSRSAAAAAHRHSSCPPRLCHPGQLLSPCACGHRKRSGLVPPLCPSCTATLAPQTSVWTFGPWAASSTSSSAGRAPLSAPPARQAAPFCWQSPGRPACWPLRAAAPACAAQPPCSLRPGRVPPQPCPQRSSPSKLQSNEAMLKPH